MKSLFKIIRRYSLSAGLIIVVILVCNLAALLLMGYFTTKDLQRNRNSRELMEAVGDEITIDGERKEYRISVHGEKILRESFYVWAMAIAPDGSVVWEWQLPQNIPREYSLQEVASFTRWYLKDYPVRVWRSGELLLVFASDPTMESRHSLFMSLEFVQKMPMYLKVLLVVNIGVILLFVFCFGWRFYRALQPIAEGIEQLSQKQPLHLKEKGMTAELAAKLNDTSEVLQEQSRKLAQRDEARTEWISGVSHDIRTPLSLIIGHADRLTEIASVKEEETELAKAIQRQSLIIGQLIQDLNLTSKLAYHSQPLRKETCSFAQLLRECVADFYNEGLDEKDSITVSISERAEQTRINADAGLLCRALRNLIGNSIRHNPAGCRINVVLYTTSNQIFCRICDSGPGIEQIVVDNLDKPDSEIHIMGLRLAAQIARAHGGELHFRERENGNYDAELVMKSREEKS